MSNSYAVGNHDERPWGHYEVIAVGDRYAVKRIVVNPGARLSLQLHYGRDEHWVMVSGKARVTLGEEVKELAENGSIFIPAEREHRIENTGGSYLIFIEVQYGKNLDENDIVRIKDDYDRINT